MSELVVSLNGLEETQRLANQLCLAAELPLVIALSGTLGAGKTQFVRFAAQSLGVPPEEVTSPTYVLLQRYRGRREIYHLDFYRLKSVDEVWDLGLDEVLEQPALVFIEWAEKFPQCLPSDHLSLNLQPIDGARELSSHPNQRTASITVHGPRSRKLLEQLRDFSEWPSRHKPKGEACD